MDNMDETRVVTHYSKTQNVCVVTRNGRVDKVTIWKTGVANSTQVLADIPPHLR
jgi:hypothetical protein